MDGILPTDIYFIIIDLLKSYRLSRLVCHSWCNYIETTNFQFVLNLIRSISNDPVFVVDNIPSMVHYYDGTFVLDDNIYCYINSNLINLTTNNYIKIQEINNSYGKHELFIANKNIQIRINDALSAQFTCFCNLPRIIRADNVFEIVTCNRYIYQNNYFKCVKYSLLSDEYYNIHVTSEIDYIRNNQNIDIYKLGNYIGTITFKSLMNGYSANNNFGIGPDYFIIYIDKIYIWKFIH